MIWDRLEMIHSTDIEGLDITLRVHFRPTTLDLVRQLIEAINRSFGGDPRFHVLLFTPSRLWGGPNDQHTDVFASPGRARVGRAGVAVAAGPRRPMLSPIYG